MIYLILGVPYRFTGGKLVKAADQLNLFGGVDPVKEKKRGKNDGKRRRSPVTGAQQELKGGHWNNVDDATPAGVGGIAVIEEEKPKVEEKAEKKNPLQMSREEFESALKNADTNQFKSQMVQDWGSGRGQGRRSGGQIKGSMSDAPKGRKTYTTLDKEKLGITSQQVNEIGILDDQYGTKERYLQGRAIGLNHDQAMGISYGDVDGFDLLQRDRPTPAPEPKVEETPVEPDGRSLEDLFIDADRLGNKYQTPEEIQAFNNELADATAAVGDVIDEQLPDRAPEAIDYSGGGTGGRRAIVPASAPRPVAPKTKLPSSVARFLKPKKFDEVKPKVEEKKVEVAKGSLDNPWAFTRAEWEREEDLHRSEVQSNFTQASKSQAIAKFTALQKLKEGSLRHRLAKKIVDEQFAAVDEGREMPHSQEDFEAADWVMNTPVTHKDVVEGAIADGKPVPQHVLDEYPELKRPPLTKSTLRPRAAARTIRGNSVAIAHTTANRVPLAKSVDMPRPRRKLGKAQLSLFDEALHPRDEGGKFTKKDAIAKMRTGVPAAVKKFGDGVQQLHKKIAQMPISQLENYEPEEDLHDQHFLSALNHLDSHTKQGLDAQHHGIVDDALDGHDEHSPELNAAYEQHLSGLKEAIARRIEDHESNITETSERLASQADQEVTDIVDTVEDEEGWAKAKEQVNAVYEKAIANSAAQLASVGADKSTISEFKKRLTSEWRSLVKEYDSNEW